MGSKLISVAIEIMMMRNTLGMLEILMLSNYDDKADPDFDSEDSL